MLRRVGLVAVVSLILGVAGAAVAAEPRAAVGRPDVMEVGEPVLISREVLHREANTNSAMAEYIAKYGQPDYAVVQRTAVEEPYIAFAPYEVRLYYVDRDQEIIFGRVQVSEAIRSFGIRKWLGPIRPETMDWLLSASARPAVPMAEVQQDEFQPAPPVVIAAAAESTGTATTEDLIERMEAAAERAAIAAETAAVASRSAEAAANRAADTIDRWGNR